MDIVNWDAYARRRNQVASAILRAVFARAEAAAIAAPSLPRIVELRHQGQMFRAQCRARFLHALLPERPGVRDRVWFVVMSLN